MRPPRASVSTPGVAAATAGSSAATVLAARSQLLRTADISTSPTRSRPARTLPPERRSAAGTGGSGSGGDIDLTVNGGRISFTGRNSGIAGQRQGAGYTAGDRFGGTVNVSITDLGGELATDGDVIVAVSGGGDFGDRCPGRHWRYGWRWVRR